MHASSFESLLGETITLTKKRWKPIVLGSLFFSVLGILLNFSMHGRPSQMQFDNVASGSFLVGALFFVFLLVLSFLQIAYQYLVALRAKPKFSSALRDSFPLLGSLLRACLWLIVVSWLIVILPVTFLLVVLTAHQMIPVFFFIILCFTLYVVFIIRALRYSLTFPILIKEKKGVLKSAETSYVRTKGYCLKILGNSLLFSLLIALTLVVLSLPAILGVFTIKGSLAVGIILMAISGIAIFAFVLLIKGAGVIFRTLLYETITAHPRKK